MIVGEIISLRALEVDDLELLKDWRNKEHFRKFFREYRELSMANQKMWFDKYVIADPSTLMFGIVDNHSKSLIGVNGLCYIDWVNRNADLSLYIGKDDIYVDTDPKGIAWESLDLLFDYAFNQINLHKVWTEIYEIDSKKQELYSEYGLRKDAVLRDNYYHDGSYLDSYIYTILSSEWRTRSH